jgi:hypothetical protein
MLGERGGIQQAEKKWASVPQTQLYGRLGGPPTRPGIPAVGGEMARLVAAFPRAFLLVSQWKYRTRLSGRQQTSGCCRRAHFSVLLRLPCPGQLPLRTLRVMELSEQLFISPPLSRLVAPGSHSLPLGFHFILDSFFLHYAQTVEII